MIDWPALILIAAFPAGAALGYLLTRYEDRKWAKWEAELAARKAKADQIISILSDEDAGWKT
jgi:hypothetical protein